MHQLGHPLLKFSHQLQKSNAIRYTINFLHSCLEDDYVNVIKGASNGNELLLFFEQAVERGDTWITVHSVAEERAMLAEDGINPLFQPPYSTHLNTCSFAFIKWKPSPQKSNFGRGSLFTDLIFSLQRSSSARMEMKTAGELLATPELLLINVSKWICDSRRHGVKLWQILQNSNWTQGGS